MNGHMVGENAEGKLISPRTPRGATSQQSLHTSPRSMPTSPVAARSGATSPRQASPRPDIPRRTASQWNFCSNDWKKLLTFRKGMHI